MQRGPLIPTIALASGIAASAASGAAWWCGCIPIAIAISIYLYILNASKDPTLTFRLGKWHIVWVALLFSGIGLTDESLNRPLSLEEAFGENVPDSLYCEVTSVLTKTYGDRIDAVIEGTNGAKARIRSGATDVSAGDIIKIPTRFLRKLSTDTTETGRRITPMLKASGILYSGRIFSNGIKIADRSSDPRYFFIRIRERIEIDIEKSHIEKETADFLKAILMGDKTGLDEQTRMTFANGGMAHMLALSGLHIGILAGFLIILMWPAKLIGRYKWGYAIAILILWLYVAVTGMAYSSVRACIMATLAFIGIMAERKNFGGNALCTACLLILLADPTALFDAGFQLSVVCVGALIAYASRLNPISHRLHPVLFGICGAIITTIVATAASWVLTSYYFSQVPLMFLPSNLLILPLLPFYICLAVVFTGMLSFGIEIGWLGSVLDHGYTMMLKSTEWLSCGTEFVIEYQIPLYGVALWMLVLAIGAYTLNRKEQK
ncbi:MAG: ComEC/Rec2 family competence protein [Muribaculaceae bacterium]|nr:ComEC/Rec2 family competence protein [Muribaculaceae bacterium]